MPLDNDFWKDDPLVGVTDEVTDFEQSPLIRGRRRGPNLTSDAVIAPPRKLLVSQAELASHLAQIANATQQAFPGAEIRKLPARTEVGIYAQVGTNSVSVKVVPDEAGQPRYRSFLMEGFLQVDEAASRRGQNRVRHLSNQVGTGDHADWRGYVGWLSWAHRQILKLEVVKLSAALAPDNCLPFNLLAPALRSAFNLVQIGLTAAEVAEDMPHPSVTWKYGNNGTQGVATLFRHRIEVSSSVPTGNLAFALRGDSWGYAAKVNVEGLNIAIEEKDIHYKREAPTSSLPSDLVLARTEVGRRAENLLTEGLLDFLWKHSHNQGLREFDLR